MSNKLSYLLMYFAFFIYSLSSVFSKIASTQAFFSLKYIFCFFIILFLMVLYAFIWQIVLKKIPLSEAMSNKPVVLIFSMIWAIFLFDEKISIRILIGVFFIFIGIIIIDIDSSKGKNK